MFPVHYYYIKRRCKQAAQAYNKSEPFFDHMLSSHKYEVRGLKRNSFGVCFLATRLIPFFLFTFLHLCVLKTCFIREVNPNGHLFQVVGYNNGKGFETRYYSVFQGFRQAKSANGGWILSSSQFLILPQLPQKMKLASKVVKVDSKIIISLPKI